MKIYWVLGYDQYYPEADNFLKSFATYKEAEDFIAWCAGGNHHFEFYDIVNILDRLY